MECFGRERECERLWARFRDGRNVLMLAPRRVGKTVLLNRLKEQSEARGYRCVVIDVEGRRDEKAFFRKMCADIQEGIGVGQAVMSAFSGRLRRVLRGTDDGEDWRSLLLKTDWSEFADHLLAQLESEKDGPPWLLLIDEIPMFVKSLLESEGQQRVHDFLYRLRNLRQEHHKIRWLYTGSIGLDTIARRNGIEGALVDLEVETLEPFDRPTAEAFLSSLTRKRGRCLGPGAADRILSRLGWLAPYYLEKIAESALDIEASDGPISVAAADRALDSMLALAHRIYWTTWREHLDKNFSDPERNRLFRILASVAQDEHGASLGTLQMALNKAEPVADEVLLADLDTLVADGYVTPEDDGTRFRFRMQLLREWWLRYVVERKIPGGTDGQTD